MSFCKEIIESTPAQRSGVSERPAHRLCPLLPAEGRCESEKLESSATERLGAAAVRHPDSRLGSAQPDMPTSSLRARIVILEAQRRELLSSNERWAKEYQTMVQYYRERTESGDVNSKLQKSKREARELKAQNSTLNRRVKHQHEEIQRLNKALEEALQGVQQLRNGEDSQEMVWKLQAEVFKEDFMKERRDREALKGKHLELEKKLRRSESERRILKSKMMCVCKHQDEDQKIEIQHCAKACRHPPQHGQCE